MNKKPQGPWGREAAVVAELSQTRRIRHLVQDGIDAAYARNGPKHFDRPAGSWIHEMGRDCGLVAHLLLRKLADRCEFSEVSEEVRAAGAGFGKCRYFRATIPAGHRGWEAAAAMSELTDRELSEVRLVRGAHGDIELQAPRLRMRPTSTLHVIIGHADNPHQPPEDNPTLYTWFPGRVLSPLQDCAVKLAQG